MPNEIEQGNHQLDIRNTNPGLALPFVYMPWSIKLAYFACTWCKVQANLRCSRCRKVFYCSQKCQKAHWSKHKQTCNKKITF